MILITWFLLGITFIAVTLLSMYVLDKYPKTKLAKLIRKHYIGEINE
jgi:hypothetical protein